MKSVVDIAPELVSRLPDAFVRFVAEGGSRLSAADDDWTVSISEPIGFLAQRLPHGSVLVASNGSGDHLFLCRTGAETDRVGSTLHVYWHEGPEIEVVADDIAGLLSPCPAAPSQRPPVFYHDGTTLVCVGDKVSIQIWLRRKVGRVEYVPGQSPRDNDSEFNGLCWVQIKVPGAARRGVLVDPNTSRLDSSVAFIERAAGAEGSPTKPQG